MIRPAILVDSRSPGRSPSTRGRPGVRAGRVPVSSPLHRDKDGAAMVRRSLAMVVLLIMGSAVLSIAGCESLREAIRTSSDDKAAKHMKPKSEAEGIFAVES